MKKTKRQKSLMKITKAKIITGISAILILFLCWLVLPAYVNFQITEGHNIKETLCKIRVPCEVRVGPIYCTESLKNTHPRVYEDVLEIPEHRDKCVTSSQEFEVTNDETRDKVYVVNISRCICAIKPIGFH